MLSRIAQEREYFNGLLGEVTEKGFHRQLKCESGLRRCMKSVPRPETSEGKNLDPIESRNELEENLKKILRCLANG
jgi:hypothetical protein